MNKKKSQKNLNKNIKTKNQLVRLKYSNWSKIIKKKFMNLIIDMSACVTILKPKLNL